MKVWFEISNPKYVHFLRFFGHVEIIRFKMLTKQQIKKASMEWVQKKARLSCLLRLQCLTATPHRGHLKPVPPIPPYTGHRLCLSLHPDHQALCEH